MNRTLAMVIVRVVASVRSSPCHRQGLVAFAGAKSARLRPPPPCARLYKFCEAVECGFSIPVVHTSKTAMTGFPPVAALADKQSTGLFGPTDKLLRNFLPISNPYPYKTKKGRTTGAHPLCLVRMTGFEPTRISSLEPETSASAVPPHPLIICMLSGSKPSTLV